MEISSEVRRNCQADGVSFHKRNQARGDGQGLETQGEEER